MIAAGFFPFRLANRRNVVPSSVPFVWHTARAPEPRTVRCHLLPVPVRSRLRLHAVSLVPGLSLAQEERGFAEGTHAVATPLSALRSWAVLGLESGMVSRRAMPS